MTKTIWLAATAIVTAALLTAPATAGGKTKDEARDQEIQELKARLERLEREAEDEKIVQSSRLKKVEDTQDAVQWTFNDGRPTVRSGDGRFELAFRGRVQLDWALYDQDASDMASSLACASAAPNVLCDLGSGAVFRRVRFGIEGKFFRDFIYELRFDFGGSDVEGNGAINIARIGYVGISGLRIQAGAMQPIMTLYDSTSSAELTTMERAAVVTAIVGPFGGDNSRVRDDQVRPCERQLPRRARPGSLDRQAPQARRRLRRHRHRPGRHDRPRSNGARARSREHAGLPRRRCRQDPHVQRRERDAALPRSPHLRPLIL